MEAQRRKAAPFLPSSGSTAEKGRCASWTSVRKKIPAAAASISTAGMVCTVRQPLAITTWAWGLRKGGGRTRRGGEKEQWKVRERQGKKSGFGHELGEAGLNEYINTKTIVSALDGYSWGWYGETSQPRDTK